MITIQILTKNNENYIQRCLESIQFQARVLIYDLGSTDNTIRLAEKYYEVHQIADKDRSSIRNQIVDNDSNEWQMYLHPYETLSHFDLNKMLTRDYWHFYVSQGDFITKEMRLWRKSTQMKFENYVFESITAPVCQPINSMIYSAGTTEDFSLHVQKWVEKNPADSTPLYYKAYQALLAKDWNKFLTLANHYLLFDNTASMSCALIKYHISMIYCYIKKEYKLAIKHVLEILMIKPLLAEFWCLLADIYYQLKEYDKAKHFYENAIILGSQRKTDDLYPIEAKKYKDYPTTMIQSCQDIAKNLIIASA